MFGFKSKEEIRREEEEYRLQCLEYQKEKEIQARIGVKRSLANMKKQAAKLEGFKKSYIDKARDASLHGNEQDFKLAKAGLKLCLQKQRVLDSMISNVELSLQINDMNTVIGDFVESVSLMSEQMQAVTPTIDMTRAQIAYEKAVANNATQYEALNAFLSSAAESVDSLDGISDGVSDDEIDNLITNQVIDSESNIDKEIEEKLQDVREKINA